MIGRWIRSLSVRLWIASVAVLAVSVSSIGILTIHLFEHYPDRFGRMSEAAKARSVARALKFDANGRPVAVDLPPDTRRLFDIAPADYKYRILDKHGTVLFASKSAMTGSSWGDVSLSESAGKISRLQIDGQTADLSTLPVRNGSSIYYVQVAMSERLVETLVEAGIKTGLTAARINFVLVIVLFGLTMTLAMHRLLQPLRSASRDATLITPRNLSVRLAPAGIPSEIRPLVDAFNEALGRLEDGFAAQQQFLASAAHELQTPLTLLRGQIELQPTLQGKEMLYREIDLMARQVRQLLHLAEVSETQNFNFRDIEIVDVAEDVIAYLARSADSGSVRLQLETSESPGKMRADKGAIFILLKNIVENAINAAPPGGTVTITIDAASLRVVDDGPGIKPEYLPHLFKRFWRAPDATHDGAGLGLAICKEIASAHAWHLAVCSGPSGTQFTVSFS
ncbi:ATP-binding protein [Paraburkholderia sp. JHI869]|uniref:sensor histidine kinase n=1 Tax=Paraburkholderia sp. JHI869 TaxID=3112959 RepID=UPI00317694E9